MAMAPDCLSLMRIMPRSAACTTRRSKRILTYHNNGEFAYCGSNKQGHKQAMPPEKAHRADDRPPSETMHRGLSRPLMPILGFANHCIPHQSRNHSTCPTVHGHKYTVPQPVCPDKLQHPSLQGDQQGFHAASQPLASAPPALEPAAPS